MHYFDFFLSSSKGWASPTSQYLPPLSCPSVGMTAAAASSGNIVDTGYSTCRGSQSYPNSAAYLSILYAEPPIRSGRF
ncbi:hypothetical protein NEOLEDRAFT_1138252 [Neolentinus lepideus HHB14362 ss-1]|uniref:Uncharacterized protein n=1 Tax=Neolentinus lepideus HHB14362 ss-1 TaxID=1314782 RepID=A0A165QEH6_9AGAM|nr:hypothetical protein NEOLEDRAFT_1138252 [Neolentinus lepideus HHB14362 ss-1]